MKEKSLEQTSTCGCSTQTTRDKIAQALIILSIYLHTGQLILSCKEIVFKKELLQV